MPDNIQLHETQSTMSGRVVFFLTLIAVLVFFWWLLIYDHGIVAAK